MSLKAIEQITDAENRAASIIENAQKQAREIISQAQNKARSQHEADMALAAERCAAISEKAAEDGRILAEEKLQEFERQAQKLKTQADSNKEDAVAAVMKRVIG